MLRVTRENSENKLVFEGFCLLLLYIYMNVPLELKHDLYADFKLTVSLKLKIKWRFFDNFT